MLSRAGHATAAHAPSGSRSRRAYEHEAMTQCLGMHEVGEAASSTAGASSASNWTEHRGGRWRSGSSLWQAASERKRAACSKTAGLGQLAEGR
jgi:hypothetical protein